MTPRDSMVSEAFEMMHRLGDGVNGGAGGETALREACTLAARLGQDEADRIWQSLGLGGAQGAVENSSTPAGALGMRGSFDRFVNWLSGSARGQMAMNQICAPLLGYGASPELSGIGGGLIKDAGINALAAHSLSLARGTALPYLANIEVEGGFTGDRPEFSILTVQPLWEDREGGNFLFNQASWVHDDGDNDDNADGDPDDTLNIGLVYRRLMLDNTLLVGTNVFFDHELDQNHNRVSVGIDAQTSLYGFAANRYLPLTKWKGIDRTREERALAGWDLELSGRLPEYPDFTGYLRGFTWDSVAGVRDIYGVDANVEWSPVPALVFTAGVQDENNKTPDVQASMRFRINLNQGLDLQFAPRVGLDDVSDRVWQKVRRENTIRTQIRKRPSAVMTVIESVGNNSVSSDEGNATLSAGLTFSMPATVTVENVVGAVARIQFSDGGVLTIGQGSQVRIEAGLITLITGTIQYVSGATNIIVNVPGGTITLLGTDIDVVTDGTLSTVRVRDGSVNLTGTTSGSVTVTAGNMAGSTNGVVAAIGTGTAPYIAHTDQVSQRIDRAGTPQTGPKVAPYPPERPRIVQGGTSAGNVIIFGLRYTKPVTVAGGPPRLAITIGANSYVAPLTGGSGTNDLRFSYTLQPADAGAPTVTVNGLDLNGGTMVGDGKNAVTTIADTPLALSGAGSDVTPPSGYAVSITTDPIHGGNQTVVAFQITGAEIGATYNYTFSSSGGGTNVTGSGTIATATQNVTGVNLTSLNAGTAQISLTLTDVAANVGAAVTDTATRLAGPTLSMDFVNNAYSVSGTAYGSLSAFLTAAGGTFTRASTASYFDSSGVMQFAAAGVPRIDHDRTSPFAARGLLIESSRTNLILRSNAFLTAPWNISTCNAAGMVNTGSTTTAPDGSLVPVYAMGTLDCLFQDFTVTLGQTYTHSIWIKANKVGTLGFRRPGGSATSNNIVVNTDWQYFTATANATTTTSRLLIDNRTSTGFGVTGLQVSFFAAQGELGASPSSYIPTVASTVTRSADSLTFTAGAWLDATNGTFTMSGQAIPEINRGLFGIPGAFIRNDTARTFWIEPNPNFGAVGASGAGPWKIAATYTTGLRRASANGSAVAGNATATNVTGLNIGGPVQINTAIQSFSYMPYTVDDASLQLFSQ